MVVRYWRKQPPQAARKSLAGLAEAGAVTDCVLLPELKINSSSSFGFVLLLHPQLKTNLTDCLAHWAF